MKLPRLIISATLAAIVTIALPVDTLARDPMFRSQNDILYSDDVCASPSSSGSASSGPSTAMPSSVTPGEGGGCGNKADNDRANMDQMWGYFIKKYKEKGYSQEEAENAAAGIMGNMRQESRLNPSISGGMGCNDSPAVGIVQWCFSRIDSLRSHAAERGETVECLGIQLEYIWIELEQPGYSHLFEAMKGKTAAEAAEIFDDGGDGPSGGVAGFEESTASDNHLRMQNATDIHAEMTGTDPGAPSIAGAGSGGPCGGPGSNSTESTTGIPAPECEALVAEFKQLRSAGKVRTAHPESNIDKDLANCTNDPISCSGGITPNTLRAFVAVIRHIDAKGLGTVIFANTNTGHPCDTALHGKGRAVDFWDCNNPGMDARCTEMFNYLHTNAEQLDIYNLIVNTPPSGFTCNQQYIYCMSDHNTHIHMGSNK